MRRFTRACAVIAAITLATSANPAPAAQRPALLRVRASLLSPEHLQLANRLPKPDQGRKHPDPAAAAVRKMIASGDRIARLPYLYGGGHGSFDASGYDCSGSVSYVLHAGGVLSTPLDSSGLEGFGEAGPGKHVTIYANSMHAWMTIDGRRFDTIAFQETGTRWSSAISSAAGYVIRHPAGL